MWLHKTTTELVSVKFVKTVEDLTPFTTLIVTLLGLLRELKSQDLLKL